MAEFRFVTTWELEAPIDAVYRAIGDSPCWPAWWKSLRSVEELAPGDADGIGRRYRYTWKSRLGYRLCFEIRVTRVLPGRSIEGSASGDVQGTGRWLLIDEGGVTRVRYEWRVRPARRWMTLVAPVAGPLFAWNHHAVMEDGATGLARWLGVRLLRTTRE
ncbi:SRPBCC family protein [Halomonas sp. C05BenzN]|uniref:SRPBCC family protein n=1 Tax=Halomonas sp. C05BenzN TaxID=3411041 RepID=UPI003B956058